MPCYEISKFPSYVVVFFVIVSNDQRRFHFDEQHSVCFEEHLDVFILTLCSAVTRVITGQLTSTHKLLTRRR